MPRVLLIAMLVAATGCQTQNPFAAIGPHTVPAPTTGQALPYYPPTVTGGAPAAANTPGGASTAAAKPARLSVSAEGTPSAIAPPSAIVAEAADREPIRIVESNAPAARTANAASRGNSASGIQAAPAASVPSGQMQPPPNRVPVTPGGKSSSSAPPGNSPAISRMRGFVAGQPTASGPPPNGSRTVAPASFQEASNNAWRSRVRSRPGRQS